LSDRRPAEDSDVDLEWVALPGRRGDEGRGERELRRGMCRNVEGLRVGGVAGVWILGSGVAVDVEAEDGAKAEVETESLAKGGLGDVDGELGDITGPAAFPFPCSIFPFVGGGVDEMAAAGDWSVILRAFEVTGEGGDSCESDSGGVMSPFNTGGGSRTTGEVGGGDFDDGRVPLGKANVISFSQESYWRRCCGEGVPIMLEGREMGGGDTLGTRCELETLRECLLDCGFKNS
jgi:hypothetical protein